jgi:hypothetical protein
VKEKNNIYTRLGISPTFRQNAHYPVFVLIMIVIIPPRLLFWNTEEPCLLVGYKQVLTSICAALVDAGRYEGMYCNG